VIFLSIVWYYALVLFFAGLIVWSSQLDSDCIRVGDTELGEGGHRLVSFGLINFLASLLGAMVREHVRVLTINWRHAISTSCMMYSSLWTHSRCHGIPFLRWGKSCLLHQ